MVEAGQLRLLGANVFPISLPQNRGLVVRVTHLTNSTSPDKRAQGSLI